MSTLAAHRTDLTGLDAELNARKALAVERKLAGDLREIVARTGLPWEQQAAVLMAAAVLIIGEVPDVKARRGKVINAMTEEMRKRLQIYLPL